MGISEDELGAAVRKWLANDVHTAALRRASLGLDPL